VSTSRRYYVWAVKTIRCRASTRDTYRRLTLRRSRQAAAAVARRLRRLALLESMCQRRSEDFVPPAAQRRLVGRTRYNQLCKLRRFSRFSRSVSQR